MFYIKQVKWKIKMMTKMRKVVLNKKHLPHISLIKVTILLN